MRVSRVVVLVLGLSAGLPAGVQEALACACCTNEGQRSVSVRPMDSGKREEIGRLRFSADAQLFSGEGDAGDVKGIAKSSGLYELHVAQEPNRWIFSFRDKASRDKTGNDKISRDQARGLGTLTLAIPATLSIFEVDPRLGEPQGGQGPSLYKEWKLTSAAAGTGLFAPGIGSGQRLTLILQGHGNSCTSGDMFSHWTLAVSGPKANYHLFGAFVQ
jgi:hypothetical protein